MKNAEMTCLIIKPDGVGKGLAGKIIDRFETEGFQLMAMRMIRPTQSLMEGFYAEHKGKPFLPAFLEFVVSGPLVVCVWKGMDVIVRVRQIIGSTDSQKAAPGTLRRVWGTDQRRNLVHASDSGSSAQREIEYFFSPEELSDYQPNAWKQAEEIVLC